MELLEKAVQRKHKLSESKSIVKREKQLSKFKKEQIKMIDCNKTKLRHLNLIVCSKDNALRDKKNSLSSSSSTSSKSTPIENRKINETKSSPMFKDKQIDRSLKSVLKHSITEERNQNNEKQNRNEKRVSFLKHAKCNKKTKLEDKPNIYHSSNRIEDDFDDEQLVIDFFDRETVPSISDSDDSYDRAIGHSDNESRKHLENSDESSIANSGKAKDDPSTVIEITIDSDEDDKCELIVPQRLKDESTAQILCSTLAAPTTDSVLRKQEENISSDSLSAEINSFAHVSKEPIHKNIAGSSEQPNYNEVNGVPKYYCVLCPSILISSESAIEHYLGHCGVYLECGQCHQKFSSLQSFRVHNNKHLDRNNMLNLEAFMNARKWCDNYIEYIERHDDIIKQVTNVNKVFCPVCHQMFELFYKSGNSYKAKHCLKLNLDECSIRNHLHQHLQYFPYECIDCKFDDKKTAFCLNHKARDHILEEHNVQNAHSFDINELEIYFNRTKSITKLDNIIKSSLGLTSHMKLFSEEFSFICNKQIIN